ncbi:MAG: hypothetical protein HY868_01805 [Chloroflexi bacterium]|nr:hypothetical protein [Chloroflexota bacterium]
MRSVFSQVISLGMALLFAAVIWIVATSEQNPSRDAFFQDALPVEVVNRAEGLVVYQRTAETVRVKVRAPQASWDQLRPASFRVSADLKGLAAGLHQVPVVIQVTDPRVAVLVVEPAQMGVRLESLKSREVEVHADVLDAPPLGYTFRTPVMDPVTVTVNGPAVLVDQIAEGVVDIFLRGSKAPIERDAVVVLRDAQGKTVSGLNVAPASVQVKVQVEQRVGYKDVSIKTVLKGNVAPGYWVSNILVLPSTATIVGNAEVMAKIQGFVETLPIDVEGATAEVTKRAVLSLPDGVSVLNSDGINVQVSVTPIIGGQTVRRRVSLQGLRSGLNAVISPDAVDVILAGPVTTLQSLTPNDIQVALDVAGLAAGTHAVKPRVPTLPNVLRVQSIVPDMIQVVITDPATPTITPTLTLPIVTPTLTLPAQTPAITATRTMTLIAPAITSTPRAAAAVTTTTTLTVPATVTTPPSVTATVTMTTPSVPPTVITTIPNVSATVTTTTTPTVVSPRQ